MKHTPQTKDAPELTLVKAGMNGKGIEPPLIERALVYACRMAWRFVIKSLRNDPILDTVVGGWKSATTLDLGAAAVFRLAFRSFARGRFADTVILDEETMGSGQGLDLTSTTCATILDPVDGTTNLRRLRTWWCVAATTILPTKPEGARIASSVVVFEDGTTMVWSREREGVFVIEGGSPRAVAGTSGRTTMDNAALAYVGQSPGAHERGFEVVHALGGKTIRIWSVGGIPALRRFIDVGQGSLGLDAIIQPDPGQVAHDVAPLLILSAAAGACVLHLDGNSVTMPEVEHLLLNPATTRISYVAASSSALARTIISLSGGGGVVGVRIAA